MEDYCCSLNSLLVIYLCLRHLAWRMMWRNIGSADNLEDVWTFPSSLCLSFVKDLLDDEDEIDEHQPFPSLSQVNGCCGEDLDLTALLHQKIITFLWTLQRSSRLFLKMLVLTLNWNGSAKWKWVLIPILNQTIVLVYISWRVIMPCLHRTEHGMGTCPRISTWTPSWTSFWAAFCGWLEKGASSSHVSTQIFAQCKRTWFPFIFRVFFPKWGQKAAAHLMCHLSHRVRLKQNKYPILFLTQGISQKYPELMDVRCQTTQIAVSFAQSENILVSGIYTSTGCAHERGK